MALYLRLFVGAALQWGLTAGQVRLLAVHDSAWGVALATVAMQSLWWLNIHGCVEARGFWGGVAWCSGAALGAVLGLWLT
jgi:hypothetical protein